MPSLTLSDSSHDLPEWWTGSLPVGHVVELEMYGDRMIGRLREAEGDTIRVSVPIHQQVGALCLSTAHGTAVISLPGGAARVPVSCWARGDIVRLQVTGPVQFVQRRIHVRIPIEVPVSLGWVIPGSRTGSHVRSHTVDLSYGGLRVAPTTTVWPGRGLTVQILLELPDGACQLRGNVVGTTPDYGLRLIFTDLASAAADRIKLLTAED